MPQQFQYFQQYQDKVAGIIGRPATNRLVAQGLVTIALGGNDYVNNYYLVPVSLRSLQYSLSSYSSYIIKEYKKYLAVIICFAYNIFTIWTEIHRLYTP